MASPIAYWGFLKLVVRITTLEGEFIITEDTLAALHRDLVNVRDLTFSLQLLHPAASLGLLAFHSVARVIARLNSHCQHPI